MFFKKKTIADICSSFLDTIISLLGKTDKGPFDNIILDIPAIMVVSSVFVRSSRKDRPLIMDKVLRLCTFKCSNESEIDELGRRIDFYFDTLVRNNLHAYCLRGLKSEIEDLSPTRLAVIFSDRLINPLCIDNYEDAPAPSISSFEASLFWQTFTLPLRNELNAFISQLNKSAPITHK